MSTQASVVTVGSINIDLVVRAQRRPQAGETFPGESFSIGPGGKGFNQAVQTALSGAHSYLVGRVGDDVFAPFIHDLIRRTGVDPAYIKSDPAGTGIGHVTVDGNGDYSSVIVARANGQLSPTDVDQASAAFESSQVLLLQLESPMATVVRAAALGREKGLTVILNQAPALPVPSELLDCVDVLVVNEVEAAMASGLSFDPASETGVDAVLKHLSAWRRDVVLTLGGHGAVAWSRKGHRRSVAGYDVPVVNTVGAGDAFIGELAARMAEGVPLFDALPLANAAGAVAVQRPEAHGSRDECERVRALAASRGE